MTEALPLLPLIDLLAIEADWEDGPDIALQVAEAQREADWQRVKPLVKALLAIQEWLLDTKPLGE